MGSAGLAVIAVAGMALIACEAGTLPPADTPAPAEPVRQSLGSALAQCTIDHGYDPAAAGGLDTLGDGEGDWRVCAHAALERVLRPRLREPHALDDLLAADLQLTEAIAAGTATRADRTAEIGARLDNMQAHERVIREQERAELSAAELLTLMDTGGEGAEVDDDLALARRALR